MKDVVFKWNDICVSLLLINPAAATTQTYVWPTRHLAWGFR